MRIIFDEDEKIEFSRFFKFVLILGIIFTGICLLSSLTLIRDFFKDDILNKPYAYDYFKNVIFYLCLSVVFFGLIVTWRSKKPFSRTVTIIMYCESIIFFISSLITPQLNGFKNMSFEILAYNDFSLLDGKFLLLGIILLISAYLVGYGLRIQEDYESTV
ncbi:amino acid transporter [Lachnospiraceae bacterium PF1-21]